MIYNFIRIAFLLLVFSSCVTHKKLLQLSDSMTEVKINHIDSSQNNYTLNPGDILDIKVVSLDQQSVAIFNKKIAGSTVNQVNEAAVFLNGYSIDDNGNISMPIIGSVHAEGLSVSMLKDSLEGQLSKYYKFATVDVKLVNFRVTILGEIHRPGTYNIYNTSTNILQIIGNSGGFTDYANRRKIRLVRNFKNESVVHILDLSKTDFISADTYYIHPNDVIYVEPLKAKPFNINSRSLSVGISALTLFVLVYNAFLRK